MLFYRRLLRISRTEYVSNDKVYKYTHTHTKYAHYNVRFTLKAFPPVLLCLLTISEIDAGDMVGEIKYSPLINCIFSFAVLESS